MPGGAGGVEYSVGKAPPEFVGQTADLRGHVVQLAPEFITALAKLVALVAQAQQVVAHGLSR